jgi:Mrp family chromosome partitioning ATPase
MSVYEALQRARQGGREPLPLPQQPASPRRRPPGTVGGGRPTLSVAPGPIAMELTPLLAAVRPLLDGEIGAVIHIVAATEGEGASTIAREFGLLAATSGHRSTLLVDADLRRPTTAKAFGCDTGPTLIDWLVAGADEEAVLHGVPGTMASAARLVGERNAGAADADSLRDLYDALRRRFELTVIDCPPVAANTYPNLLPNAADGVIMVIEAEAIRPAVVSHAKAQIEATGANLLGAVLNRRSNYIPNFLYRML